MSDLLSELRAVKEKHGKLTPRLVLEEARDESHPLHNRFEWNDAVAAEAYRLAQAQKLIMSVKLSWTNPDGELKQTRRYYAIRASDADEYDYEDVEDAMKDRFRRELLLNEMQRRIDELVVQYGRLNEFWEYLKGTRRKRKTA